MIEELRTKTKYPKIYVLHDRDSKGKITPSIHPKLDGIMNIKKFFVTEKLNGINCGIVITPKKEVLIRKRSNFIEDDKNHHIYFQGIGGVNIEKIKDYFADSKSTITIYGEVCGKGIQKYGEIYSDKPIFRVFDVRVNEGFFDWKSLVSFCKEVGLKHTPYLGEIQITDFTIENFTKILEGYRNKLSDKQKAEGIVIRSSLHNKFGEWMRFKVKFEDYDGE